MMSDDYIDDISQDDTFNSEKDENIQENAIVDDFDSTIMITLKDSEVAIDYQELEEPVKERRYGKRKIKAKVQFSPSTSPTRKRKRTESSSTPSKLSDCQRGRRKSNKKSIEDEIILEKSKTSDNEEELDCISEGEWCEDASDEDWEMQVPDEEWNLEESDEDWKLEDSEDETKTCKENYDIKQEYDSEVDNTDLESQKKTKKSKHKYKKRESFRKKSVGEDDDESNPYSYKKFSSGVSLQCSVCNAIFQSYIDLNSHMIEHTKNKEFCCYGCDFISNELPIIIDHKKKCTGDEIYRCFICVQEFRTLKKMFNHIRDQIVFKCVACKYVAHSKDNLQIHSEKYHDSPQKYIKCMFKCDNSMKFRKTKQNPKYECKKCRLWFTRQDHLSSHNKAQHKKIFECNYCNSKFTTNKDLLIHMNEHKPKMQSCFLCNYRTRNPENMEVHMDYHHRPTIDNYPKYDCPVCEFRSALKSDLKNHMSEHSGVKLYSCDLCHKLLSSEQSHARHQLVHVEDRPFPCNICDRSFKTKENLESHMKTHNPPPKTLKCKLCDYMASTKLLIMKHFQRVHTNEKPYSCSYCSFCCNDETTLRRHVRRHANEERQVKCPQCNYKCYENSTLKRHMKSHEGNLPYHCTKCDFKCNHKGTLTKHVLRHDENKSLICHLCDYSTISEKALAKHISFHSTDSKIPEEISHFPMPSISMDDVPYVEINGYDGPHEEISGYDVPRVENKFLNTIYEEINGLKEDTASPMSIPSEDTLINVNDNCVLTDPAPEETDKSIHVEFVDDETIEVTEYLEEPSIELDTYFNDVMHQDTPDIKEMSIVLPTNDEPVQTVISNGIVLSNLVSGIDFVPNSNEFDPSSYKNGYIVEVPNKLLKGEDGSNVQIKFEMFLCPLCNLNFQDEPNLQEHLKFHPTEFPFSCKLCDYRFSVKKHLYKHNLIHKDKIMCNFCPYSTPCQSSMVIHMRKHTGEKPFKCGTCHKCFTTKGAMMKHAIIHSSNILYKCVYDYCKFQTTCEDAFKIHYTKHETKEPPPIFKCSECSYTTKTRGALERHFTKHTGEKNFQCIYCDFKTNDQTSMKRHTWRHTNKSKDLSCHLCDYKCYVSSTLKRHMKTHDGTNQLQCSKCDFKCNFKGTLTKHLKSHV